MRAIDALCNRVAYLASGRVKSFGPVTEQLNAYMRDVNMSETSLETAPANAGMLVQISSLRLSPNPCKTGSTLHFEVGVHVTVLARISDLAVLIYSQDETRVAVLDLRRRGLPYEFPPGPHLVSGTVGPVQLIAGDIESDYS